MAGAVAGGLAAVRVVEAAWAFAPAALLGGALFFGAVRWIDQPRRISNLGVEGSAKSVASPITVELPNILNHRLASELFVLEVKRHV